MAGITGGWSGWPLTTSSLITYDQIIQLWAGWLRRKFAMGQTIWPPPDNAFPGGTDSGTVASASMDGNNLRVTCNIGSSWGVALNGVCSEKRWVNYHCTPCNLSIMPSSYDVVIVVDLYSPRTHIRARIVDQESPTSEGGTGVLICDLINLQNATTAGYITGIGDLQGKEYYILKSGGKWMSDRWPEQPDDQQQWRGSASGGTGHFGDDLVTVYATLTDSDPKTAWALNKWAGKQVMVYGAGNRLQRLTILQNDATTMYVANDANAAGIGGVYAIVDVGKKCTPDRKLWNYQQWVTGMGDIAAGHLPDDTLSTVAVPRQSYKYNSGNPCATGIDCSEFPLTVTVLDKDYQADPLDICAGSIAGSFINTDVWKSFRMLMIDMEENCGAFIPQGSYEGASVINPYTPATWYKDMGCASSSTSTQFFVTNTETSGDTTYEYGYYYFTVSGDFIGRPIRWTVLDKNGKTYTTGKTASGPDGKITAFILPYNGKDVDLIGVQVIYSLPWKRVRPRLVQQLYELTSFIPTVGSVVIGGDPQVIDPPVAVQNDDGTYDCSLTGLWKTSGASAAATVIVDGILHEAEPFVVGEVYRYIGRNYRDPFPGGPVDGQAAMLNPYHDKFYQGRLSKTNQRARDASKSGRVSAGNHFSLTQKDHNWGSDWANGGTLRTESFMATAGNTTSFTDATKDTTNNHLKHACWLTNNGPRYAEKPYDGFIFEVDKTRTLPNPDATVLAVNPQATVQQTVTFKVPIKLLTSGAWGCKIEFEAFQIPKYTSSNQTWTWENFTVGVGDQGRINEPKYQLNKWKGRKLDVVAKDGTVVLDKEPILRSDSDTLYFAAQSQPIPADSTFIIYEMEPGVYKWTGSEFVPAEGADHARVSVGSPNDFLEDINFNNEGWIIDYGIPEYHDMMHPVWLNQIWKGQDLLRWTKGPLSWTNKASDTAEPEKNGRDARANIPYWTESPQYYADLMASADAYGIPHDNVAYNDHDKAWKRAWHAIFDVTDPYHSISEAEYGDILNGGDGTQVLSGDPPQQSGHFEDVYNYSTKYDGYYLCCGCNSVNTGDICDNCTPCGFGNLTDDGNVLFGGINMKAVEQYGFLAAQRGFKRLNATVEGVVYTTISAADPDEGYTFPYGKNYCLNSRTFSLKYKFEAAGSGAQYRKYHVYSTWGVSKGTTTNIYGPKYGSKQFLGEPETNKLPCENITCTYTYGETTTNFSPCQVHDDYGDMGWYTKEQFTIIKWDMEGF